MALREVRDSLGKRVDAAHYTGETTIITTNGEPRAALVPLSEYERLADLETRVSQLERLTIYSPQTNSSQLTTTDRGTQSDQQQGTTTHHESRVS